MRSYRTEVTAALCAVLALLGCTDFDQTSDLDDETDLEQWIRRADEGAVWALNHLGVMYYEGEGVPQDYVEAVRWWRKSADQGSAYGQAYLGMMYREGKGVPLDPAEAVRWYRKAAEQGHATAQYHLGVMYFAGEGIPKDPVLAHVWINLALAAGYESLKDDLWELSLGMTKDQVALAQELAREWHKQHSGQTSLR